MQKLVITFILCFILTSSSFCQTRRGVSTYLFTQYTKTLYDYTIGNNPWGIGLGVQALFNNKTKFTPIVELSGDLYLEDDKVLRLNPDGSIQDSRNDIDNMISLFVGSSFHLNESIYLSLLAGTGFINGQTHVGMKPSFGVYFSRNRKWTGRVSYINIFNRTKLVDEDFGSVSLAIGFKLF
jgi:hypothetical protein